MLTDFLVAEAEVVVDRQIIERMIVDKVFMLDLIMYSSAQINY